VIESHAPACDECGRTVEEKMVATSPPRWRCAHCAKAAFDHSFSRALELLQSKGQRER
jgi:hypothetical protein